MNEQFDEVRIDELFPDTGKSKFGKAFFFNFHERMILKLRMLGN